MEELKVLLAPAFDRDPVLAFCQKTRADRKNRIHFIWDKWFADPPISSLCDYA